MSQEFGQEVTNENFRHESIADAEAKLTTDE